MAPLAGRSAGQNRLNRCGLAKWRLERNRSAVRQTRLGASDGRLAVPHRNGRAACPRPTRAVCALPTDSRGRMYLRPRQNGVHKVRAHDRPDGMEAHWPPRLPVASSHWAPPPSELGRWIRHPCCRYGIDQRPKMCDLAHKRDRASLSVHIFENLGD